MNLTSNEPNAIAFCNEKSIILLTIKEIAALHIVSDIHTNR